MYDEGYPVLEIQQLGLVYRGSAGEETEYTQHMKKTYIGFRKVSR